MTADITSPDALAEARRVLGRLGRPTVFHTAIGDVPAIVAALAALVDQATVLNADRDRHDHDCHQLINATAELIRERDALRALLDDARAWNDDNTAAALWLWRCLVYNGRYGLTADDGTVTLWCRDCTADAHGALHDETTPARLGALMRAALKHETTTHTWIHDCHIPKASN